MATMWLVLAENKSHEVMCPLMLFYKLERAEEWVLAEEAKIRSLCGPEMIAKMVFAIDEVTIGD